MAGELIAGAQVVARAVQLLKLVSERGGGRSVCELVAKSGFTRPTTYRLLSALQSSGLIEQDAATKRWYLGPESYVLGTLAARRFNIERLARDFLMRLANETGESAFLSIRRGSQCVCLLREEGTYPIRTHVLQPGDRFPLGVGSAGLAILAASGDAEITTLLEANRDELARRYPSFSTKLIKQFVVETREAGYAINRGLLLTGSWGLAAVVRDNSGEPIGALSITAIEARLKGRRQIEIGRLLIVEAERLAGQLLPSQKTSTTKRNAA
jgi:DNA-binding IclR family transcriptional regulator